MWSTALPPPRISFSVTALTFMQSKWGFTACPAKSQTVTLNSHGAEEQVINYKQTKLDGRAGEDGQLMTYLSKGNHHWGILQLCLQWRIDLRGSLSLTVSPGDGNGSIQYLLAFLGRKLKATGHAIKNSSFTWNNKMKAELCMRSLCMHF